MANHCCSQAPMGQGHGRWTVGYSIPQNYWAFRIDINTIFCTFWVPKSRKPPRKLSNVQDALSMKYWLLNIDSHGSISKSMISILKSTPPQLLTIINQTNRGLAATAHFQSFLSLSHATVQVMLTVQLQISQVSSLTRSKKRPAGLLHLKSWRRRC